MGDESPHQDDAFWSLAVNRDRPSPAVRPSPGTDAPVDRVVRERSDDGTSTETRSPARTLRFVRPRGPATSPRGAAVSDHAADGHPISVADREKRAAAGGPRAQSQVESYRVEANRRKTDFWDVVTHPMVVAVGSLTFFSLIGMLWLQDPVVRPPAPDDGSLPMLPAEVNSTAAREPSTGAPTAAVTELRPAESAASTPEAVASERSVATSGIAPADTASATAAAASQVATRTTPAPSSQTALPPTAGARPLSALSATTGSSDRTARPAAASAAESNAAPAAAAVRAAAAPEVRSAAAVPEPSAARAEPAPSPAPAAAPDANPQTVSAAQVAPPSVPTPNAVETPQPRSEPIDQPSAGLVPPRAEEPHPPGAAPGGAGQREAVLVSGPLPRYPESVKRIGQAGVVDVDVTIDPGGRVTRAEALNGPRLLQGFAEDAVLKWRYEPAVSNGVPVESRRRVRIVFR